MWSTAHPPALALGERLAGLAPAGIGKVFFTSGGSEAVEAAWKIVRQVHAANGEPGRHKAIARKIAYHGVTLGALALTGVERFKEPFGPPAIVTRHVSNTNSFRSAQAGAALALRAAQRNRGEAAVIIPQGSMRDDGCFGEIRCALCEQL